jgi:hypothetical protein
VKVYPYPFPRTSFTAFVSLSPHSNSSVWSYLIVVGLWSKVERRTRKDAWRLRLCTLFFPSAPPRVFNQALKVPYYSQAHPTLVLDSFLRPGTFHRYGEVSAPGNDSVILSTNPPSPYSFFSDLETRKDAWRLRLCTLFSPPPLQESLTKH